MVYRNLKVFRQFHDAICVKPMSVTEMSGSMSGLSADSLLKQDYVAHFPPAMVSTVGIFMELYCIPVFNGLLLHDTVITFCMTLVLNTKIT